VFSLQISNNVQPEVDAILDVQDLFAKYPFGFHHLLRRHKIHLVCLCVHMTLIYFSSSWSVLCDFNSFGLSVCFMT